MQLNVVKTSWTFPQISCLIFSSSVARCDLILSNRENSTEICKRSGHHFSSWCLFRQLTYRGFETTANRSSVCVSCINVCKRPWAKWSSSARLNIAHHFRLVLAANFGFFQPCHGLFETLVITTKSFDVSLHGSRTRFCGIQESELDLEHF